MLPKVALNPKPQTPYIRLIGSLASCSSTSEVCEIAGVGYGDADV